MADALTDAQAARVELHKSSYWPSALKQKGNNHLWLTDVHLAETIDALIAPLPPPPPPAPLPSTVIPGIGLFRAGTSPANIPNKESYELLEVSWDDAAAIGNIPGKAIMYVQGVACEPTWNTGVPYQQASDNGWLFPNKSSYGDYAAKIGDDGYINAWITNVIAKLKASPGVDGIFQDNAIENLGGLYGFNTLYTDFNSYLAAQVKFLTKTGTALKNAGYEVILNAGAYIPGDGRSNDATTWQTWWQQLGPYATYLCCESWQETSEGSNTLRKTGTVDWLHDFEGWQRLPSWAHAAGCKFLGITYGDTAHAMYGRAATLLDYMPGDIFCSDQPLGSWSVDVGNALSAKSSPSAAVWQRQFEKKTWTLDANTAVASYK